MCETSCMQLQYCQSLAGLRVQGIHTALVAQYGVLFVDSLCMQYWPECLLATEMHSVMGAALAGI